ncbi:MAG TPA: MFS transporter [Candidatus Dormibacteraeota bacterium]
MSPSGSTYAPPSAVAAPSYRGVLAVEGMPRLVGAQLLARTGQQMVIVALVLFTLARFGSGMAGLVVFLSIFPGLLASPFAGALLDRHGRIRLITLDYAVAAATVVLIVLLDHLGHLSAGLLCAVVALGSLTFPLSNSGTRALYPMVLPRRLWDRANALDSSAYVIAAIVGPAVAGALVALRGGAAALLVTGAVYAAAALVVLPVAEPAVGGHGRGLLRDARDGIAYLMRSPSLRGLAVCLCVFNLGFGMVTVALPILVLGRLGGTAGEVGLLWALLGVGGLAGALVAGSFSSEARERQILAGGMLLSVVGLATLAVAPGLLVAGLGMTLIGLSNGPTDIGLFALRQRRTHVQWMGRVFAVSMALNFSGYPIGGAIAGQLAGTSPRGAFALATLLALAGTALGWWLIPARWEAAGTPAPDAVAVGAQIRARPE